VGADRSDMLFNYIAALTARLAHDGLLLLLQNSNTFACNWGTGPVLWEHRIEGTKSWSEKRRGRPGALGSIATPFQAPVAGAGASHVFVPP
jgi:hypothetical protein